MTAHNFNLRGIPSTVMTSLKQEAERLRISVNALVLNLVEQGLGLARKRTQYHDIEPLTGTWTEEEAKEFEENIRPFEQIDPEMWE